MNVSLNAAVLPDKAVYELSGVKETENSYVQGEDKNITVEEKYVSEINLQVYEKDYDYVEKQMEEFCEGKISSEELKGIIGEYLSNRIDSNDADATSEEIRKWLTKSYDNICHSAVVLANKVNMVEGIEVT